jgi:AcrR family transcriptional regulator
MVRRMANKAVSRGEYRKTARRREEIVDAAFIIFARSGFTNASMTDIAASVGLTLPGLRHHYKSKEELLEAVINRRDLEVLDLLRDHSGLDTLRALVDVAERDAAFPEHSRLFVVMSAEAANPDHPLHTYFSERYALILSNVAAAFADVAAAGQLREGVDPTEAARVYIATADGFQLQALYAGSLDTYPASVQSTLQAFLTVELGPSRVTSANDVTSIAGSGR